MTTEQTEALEGAAADFGPKQGAMVDQWLSGHAHALSDYRAFAGAARATAPALLKFSESNVGNPAERFAFDGQSYSRSALNYLMGLTFLSAHTDIMEISTVLEIGGGFATLGEIIAKCWPAGQMRYVDADIPPTCQFADHYLKGSCPDAPLMTSLEASEDRTFEVDTLPTLTVLPNWQVPNLSGKIDLFVNFISFQEMEPAVVSNYLDHVDRLRPEWILLRNMREGKQKRSATNAVGVQEPILIDAYAKMLPNYRPVATETTVFGYVTSDGFHSDLVLLKRAE